MKRAHCLPVFSLVLILVGLSLPLRSLANDGTWPHLHTDIPWSTSLGFQGVAAVEDAFNHARRQEEGQLGLQNGVLGRLDLPSQEEWNRMTIDARALYLINAERTARDGILPGISGLPLAGVESHVDRIAHRYGDMLFQGNKYGHYFDGPPADRIQRDPDIGTRHASPRYFGEGDSCHQYMIRAENLAMFVSSESDIPLPLERAIYGWLYTDSAADWGHREAVLLQHDDSGHPGKGYGYSNNNDGDQSEGFLGVYVRVGAGYMQAEYPWARTGALVVMDIFDPVADSDETGNNCHYDVAVSNADLEPLQGKALRATIPLPSNKWMQIALAGVPATADQSLAAIFGDDINLEYGRQWVLYRYDFQSGNYVRVALSDVLVPGVGYWIIQISDHDLTLDLPATASATYSQYCHGTECYDPNFVAPCQSRRGCYEIPLQAADTWMMLGNVFRDPVSVEDARVVTQGGPCDRARGGCTLAEASNRNIINDYFWQYNGNGWDLLRGSGAFFPAGKGFWARTKNGMTSAMQAKLLIPHP